MYIVYTIHETEETVIDTSKHFNEDEIETVQELAIVVYEGDDYSICLDKATKHAKQMEYKLKDLTK